jgi:hypothetical protein
VSVCQSLTAQKEPVASNHLLQQTAHASRLARWFGKHWWRGLRRLGGLYAALLVAYATFHLAEALPRPVTVGIDIAVLAALLLLVPFFASAAVAGPEEAQARQNERLRPLVDELATRLGLDWNQHWLRHVDALVQAGKAAEAAQEYRARSGVPGEEAQRVIRDWETNEPERKLRAALQRLQESEEDKRGRESK